MRQVVDVEGVVDGGVGVDGVIHSMPDPDEDAGKEYRDENLKDGRYHASELKEEVLPEKETQLA